MKNLLKEKASDPLRGRNLALIDFIKDNNFKDKLVLDVGCGFGWLEFYLKNQVKEIIGIDFDRENIKTCKKYIKEKNVRFEVSDALNLPIKTESVDVVISSELLEHLPKDSEIIFFNEIFRVLKKDGVLYLTTPFNNFWSNLLDPAFWLIGHRHYSYGDLREMANNSGLKVVKYKIGGKWWSMINLINFYMCKWVFKRKEFFEDFLKKKEKEEFFKNDGYMNIFLVFKKI